MKKILLTLVSLLFLCSCDIVTEEEHHEWLQETYQKYSELYELTFENEDGEMETHEFVFLAVSNYKNGLAHWPGCKYCKHKNNNH